jgi:hypothetical protein
MKPHNPFAFFGWTFGGAVAGAVLGGTLGGAAERLLPERPGSEPSQA